MKTSIAKISGYRKAIASLVSAVAASSVSLADGTSTPHIVVSVLSFAGVVGVFLTSNAPRFAKDADDVRKDVDAADNALDAADAHKAAATPPAASDASTTAPGTTPPVP